MKVTDRRVFYGEAMLVIDEKNSGTCFFSQAHRAMKFYEGTRGLTDDRAGRRQGKFMEEDYETIS